MPARREAWPQIAGCIGPKSPAVWNRLSLAQVDDVCGAAIAGFRIRDIVELTGARRGDVVGCLMRHGLLARAIANAVQRP